MSYRDTGEGANQLILIRPGWQIMPATLLLHRLCSASVILWAVQTSVPLQKGRKEHTALFLILGSAV